MTITTAAGQAMWKLLFENANWANIGDATGLRGSTVAGNFRVGLHTGAPGVAGTQLTSECNYGGYVRESLARGTVEWTATGLVVVIDNALEFVKPTSGSNIITHFHIGTDLTGAGNLIVYGALAIPYTANSGKAAPKFAAGELSATLT